MTSRWASVAIGAAGAVVLAAVGVPVARGAEVPAAKPSLAWSPCAADATAQCATLRVPVAWADPGGPSFALALARRTATDPGARVGSLVFGPGGPGDSGVDRIVTGMSRFSPQLRSRFDIVSFDSRGVGASHPVMCSTDLLNRQPSPAMTSQADFDATLAYNRELRADCRARTGPLFDHVDTLSQVKDLEAIRAALGETKLTFHGSSNGTLLGEQYAEAYPRKIRAMVLESVVDHSLGVRRFLDTQAATTQDSFNGFVAWCERTDSCALHGRDVRAVWAGLLGQAPFALIRKTANAFYGPDWAGLAQNLADLDAGGGSAPAQPSSSPAVPFPQLAILCADWSLPVRDYREYAGHLGRLATTAPDMRYNPIGVYITSSCLGSPAPANPQHRLTVHGSPTILLSNARHDPADSYAWATNVTRQLRGQGVLLTYEGYGHGSYNGSDCTRNTIDDYLIRLTAPARGTSCPAVEPS